jgi:hypothetical protein
VTRVTIRVLPVRETSISDFTAALLPGTVLTECKVVCDHSAERSEPYQVHFRAGGREYACPLYAFQPRTECWSEEAESPVGVAARTGVAVSL